MEHGCGVAILSHKCINPEEHKWFSQVGTGEERILLIQRGITAPTFSGYWGFPAGLVDSGESPRDAAVREALEEIGVQFNANEKPFWEGELPGRKLSYFHGEWVAPAALEMQLDEVSGFGWFTFEDALQLPLAFRYNKVIKGLM